MVFSILISGVEEIRKSVVPLINDARASAKNLLQEMMGNMNKKKKTSRELEYDEELDGETLDDGDHEEPQKEGLAKAKAKGKAKAKAKPKAASVPKSEGDIVDPKKVTPQTQPQP